MRSAPTLKIWMTPFASVAMLEKFALLRIARCRAPALSSAASSKDAGDICTAAFHGRREGGRAGACADPSVAVGCLSRTELGGKQTLPSTNLGLVMGIGCTRMHTLKSEMPRTTHIQPCYWRQCDRFLTGHG